MVHRAGSSSTRDRIPQPVALTESWLQSWLPCLSGEDLKVYVELTQHFADKPAGSMHDLETQMGVGAHIRVYQALPRLEHFGLIESMQREQAIHFHFPHRDIDGRHWPDRVLPSIRDALEFQRQITEELLRVSSLDDTDELREEYFQRYPELREEWIVYEETKDQDSPSWRLWLELSRTLIHSFERRFGALKNTHNAIFKESAAQILSHKVSIIDAITEEVFEQREKIFPEIDDELCYIISTSDAEFMAQPLVQSFSERYAVGPAQVFVNTLEYIAQKGYCVAEVNDQQQLVDLLLPSTTGLTKSEARILFLRPEERNQGEDNELNRERVRRATNKYANHLMEHGVSVLKAFEDKGRVKSRDGLIEIIAVRVNESLELVPNHVEDDEEPITEDHVIEKYKVLTESDSVSAN